MRLVNVHEAKTNLSRLLQAVEDGEEVVIARDGMPVVRLVAYEERKPRTPGSARGQFHLPASFFEPLTEEVLEGFEP